MVRIPSLVLYHGTTMHGMQVQHPRYQFEPSSYYHVTGPIGHLFRAFRGSPLLSEVGVVGLGVGSLAAYGEPGQRFTFYEIDPAVIAIARDQFTYLRDTRAQVRTILGDGRLALAAEPDGRFSLLVIDGFSSDAVPVHLLTREAIALYLRKLQPGGLLALHLSSLHFDLVPVVAEIAASLGASGLVWVDTEIKGEASIGGKFASHWVVMAPEPGRLDPLRADGRWRPLADARNGKTLVWTDNHSSPLGALRHW
jgi:spermidine synthase